MLVTLSETLNLGAPQEDVWRLLRDTGRLASLLPGVENVTPSRPAPSSASALASQAPVAATTGGNSGAEEAYTARLTDKVGPFRLSLNLEVRVLEAAEPSLLRVALKGTDGGGANRVTGTLSAALKKAEPAGTVVSFDASVEVLGRLASLGAGPIRRRTQERFAEFAGRFEQAVVQRGDAEARSDT